MITISPVVLQKEDGTSERITIEAVSYEEHGQNVFNGIYTLTASREVPDAESENDPMASIAGL